MSITVITPHYNMTGWLSRCIGSVQDCIQDIDEHILVDDSSTQAEFDRLLEIVADAERCTILRNPKNLGVLKTLEVGFLRAKSSHVIFLAADDWLISKNIRLLNEFTEQYPSVGIIIGDLIVARQKSDNEEDFTQRLVTMGPKNHSATPVKSPRLFLSSSIKPRMHGQACISKDSLLRRQFYDSKLRWNSELYMHQVIAIEDGIISVRIPFTAFRKRRGSFGEAAFTNRLRQIATLTRLLAELKRQDNNSIRDVYIGSGQLWIQPHSLAALLRLREYEFITAKYLFLKTIIFLFRRFKRFSKIT